MARLPVPGGDDSVWGSLLNEFLLIEHNSDGTHKPGVNPDATAVSKGKLQLAGDLSGTAAAPQLVASGVAAGSYTLSSITVDSKGRITAAANGTVTSAVTSVAGKTGAVTLAESDISGLASDLATTEKTTNKNIPNGYAGLTSSSTIATAQLGTGPRNTTTFLRGDGTFASPPTGSSGQTITISAPGDNSPSAPQPYDRWIRIARTN